jgi:hypothetical protein
MLELRDQGLTWNEVSQQVGTNFRMPIARMALGASSGSPLTTVSKETDMPTTIINLKVKTVEEKAVPPQNNQLSKMMVSDDDISEINGDTSLRGQRSSFSSAFASQISGFARRLNPCRRQSRRQCRETDSAKHGLRPVAGSSS